jgi:predicted transcriptional regulator
MKIRDICRHEIVTIDEGASLQEAANLMRARHVGALVVTTSAGGEGAPTRVAGVVTDRDLVIEVLARNLKGADVRVRGLASDKLVAVPGEAGVAEAVAEMGRAGVRRLLVTAEEGQVVGLVSTDDLLEALAGELSALAAALRSGIARESAERPAIASPSPRPVFLPLGTPGMPWPGA